MPHYNTSTHCHFRGDANCVSAMRHVVLDHAARARYREPNGMWLDGCEGVGGAWWDVRFRSPAEKKDLKVRTKTPEKSGKDKCGEDVDVSRNPDHRLKDTQMRLGRLNVCSGQEKVGHLGSRLEDEEWVCGCVDWDDEGELGGIKIEIETETGKYQDCELGELRSRIEDLEAHLSTLRSDFERVEAETSGLAGEFGRSRGSMFGAVNDEAGDHQLHSQSTQTDGREHEKYAPNLTRMRGGEEQDSIPFCECAHDTNTSSIPVIHLKPDFAVESGSEHVPDYVLDSPVTVYHFPDSADGNAIGEDVLRKHVEDREDVRTKKDIIKIEGPESEYQTKIAIARLFNSSHLLDMWSSGCHDKTFIVPDQTSTPGRAPLPRPHMGCGNDPTESVHNDSFMSDLDRMYDHLAQITSDETMSPRTQAWTNVAGTLQMRNNYLERQIEEYKDMHASAVADLKWNMERLAELEDEIEVVREERVDALVELGFLKKKEKEREKEVKRNNEKKEKEKMQRLKNDDKPVSQVSPLSSFNAPSQASQTQPRQQPATSFYFYPSRSVIILPGIPAQILQFPRGTTLHDIRKMLNRQHKNNKTLNPCASQVRDIMNIREAMGIQLPKPISDDAVLISLPDVRTTHPSTKIAAWQTIDNDSTPCPSNITKDSISPRVAHTSSTSTPSHAIAYPPNPTVSSPSICSCTLCSFDINPYAPPMVSVRGGGGDEDEYDFGDYNIDDLLYDSDDEDDDVDHEDDVPEPWKDRRGGEKDDWNDFGDMEFDSSAGMRIWRLGKGSGAGYTA